MSQIERWKYISGTDSRYMASNFGRIKSVPYQTIRKDGKPLSVSGRILSPAADTKGYLRTAIYGGKTVKVHRLVAEAFIKNPRNLPEVNHIDGNKENNRVDNLEWISHSDNVRHAHKIGKYRRPPQKLSDKEVEEIRQRYRPYCRTNGTNALASEYGVSAPYVWRIVTGVKRLEVKHD